MGEFNSDDHYIYYCGQESLRRSGVAIMVNKRVQNAVLGCNLKNGRMIFVCFQGKLQVYAPTSNAEEAEVEWFYEDLQDLAPWKKNYDQPRWHINKQRYYFANKGLSSQGYGFSSGHV